MLLSISVIIPALNEEQTIRPALESVLRLAPDEILVVDGGSVDRTRELAASMGVKVLSSERGRAPQMNAGAHLARGQVLLFLHADTCLPLSALADVRGALRDPSIAGGRFDIALDGA